MQTTLSLHYISYMYILLPFLKNLRILRKLIFIKLKNILNFAFRLGRSESMRDTNNSLFTTSHTSSDRSIKYQRGNRKKYASQPDGAVKQIVEHEHVYPTVLHERISHPIIIIQFDYL